MVSFNLIAGGLAMCFAVSLCRCEVNDNSLLTQVLSKPIGSEESRFSEKHGKDKSNPHFQRKGDFSSKSESSTETEENQTTGNDSDESGFSDLRLIYEECRKRMRRNFDGSEMENDYSRIRKRMISLYNCMKVFSFRRLDDFLSDDVIPISRYFEFVRDPRNGTNSEISQRRTRTHSYVVDILGKNWIDLTLERIETLLSDHSLKFRFGEDDHVRGRGRRRDHRMFAMMMMGFVIMASILVPMGFQFLTVLGGKSLLMAKMALIMSAINGLKKIATSNVGYGLYHAGPEAFHHDPHHHAFHDKIFHIKAQEQPESPFNVVI